MSYEFDDDEFDLPSYSTRKFGKPLGPNAPHYPNKAERKLLTRMMQKSGQTEEEVRKSKSNRQKLAAAAKSMQGSSSTKNSRQAFELKRRKRNIAFYLGVPVWDKQVEERLNDTRGN